MARLHWNYNDGPPDEMYKMFVRTMPGIRAATLAAAEEIGTEAKAKLAVHHANNADDPRPDSYIEVESGDIVDAFVKLVDPDEGALQIAYFNGILGEYAFGGQSKPRSRLSKIRGGRK